MIIEAPFPNVAGHVFHAEWTRSKRKRPDRRTFRITIVDLTIAPGENGVPIGKIRQIAAAS